jgi:hypothetical protein
MADSLPITETVPAAVDPMPVRHDESAAISAELAEGDSVVLSDGRTRFQPVPVVIVEEAMHENAAGQMIDAVPMNITNLEVEGP